MVRSLLFSLVLLTITVSVSALPHPKVFVANNGQWPAHVLYGAPTPDGFVWITTTGMVIDQRAQDAALTTKSHLVTLAVIGSKGTRDIRSSGSLRIPTVAVHQPGTTGDHHPNASRIVVRNVLHGIHLEYVWDGERVRFNVLADAGTPIPQPLFSVQGANEITASTTGAVCSTPLGSITLSDVMAYQAVPEQVRPVSVVASARTLGFAVGNVQTDRPLTIDPVVHATSIHGSANEEVTSTSIAKNGNVIVTGWTTSFDLPQPDGGTTSYAAKQDGFVAVYTPDLRELVSWAYIGGSGNDAVRSSAVNSKGEVWVTGETASAGLPFPPSAITGVHSGTVDGFIVRMSADLKTIQTGMYIAGNKEDRPLSIAVGKNNEVAVSGHTNSTSGMPTAPGFSNVAIGDYDAFVVTLNDLGSIISTFTYFGSPGNDAFTSVTFDPNGAVVVGGWTSSNEFKTAPEKTLVFIPDPTGETEGRWEEVGNNPYDNEYNGGPTDAIVAKFLSDGALVFSTYFGGANEDAGACVVTNADGDIYMVGATRSANLPVIDGSGSVYSGNTDAFLAVISSNGLRLRSALYYGGSGADEAVDAMLDESGNVVIIGSTTSSDLVQRGAGTSAVALGGVDAFLAVLTTQEIKFSTLAGWSGDDRPTSMALDSRGDCYFGGASSSTINNVATSGEYDAFVAKWAFGSVVVRTPTAGTVLCAGKQAAISWITEEIPSSDTYDVDASPDLGVTWTSIASGLRSKNFNWTIPTDVPASGSYRFRVRTIHGHAALSPSDYSVGAVPTITAQPTSTIVCPSEPVVLSVVVSGDGVTYQWRKNGLPISGATSPTYTIAQASESDAGAYEVVVANACTNTTSASATLKVMAQPVITKQPVSLSIEANATIQLSVEAEGPSLSYQWQHNGSPVAAPEGTQATLVLTNVRPDQQGVYRCIVTSPCGSATSNDATVSVVTNVSEENGATMSSLVMYPQPASDDVFIRSTTPLSGDAYVVIRDMNGIELLRQAIEPASTQTGVHLSVRGIASGIYAVEVASSTSTFRTLMLINR